MPDFLKDYRLNKAQSQFLGIPRNAATNLAKIYLKMDSLDKAHKYIRISDTYFSDLLPFQFGEQQEYEKALKQYYKHLYLYHKNSR